MADQCTVWCIFLQKEEQEHPDRTRLLLPYCNLILNHTVNIMLCERLFYFIASLLGSDLLHFLYLPRGPGKLGSARVKQSDQANSINPEHLFFMIVDNLVVLLFIVYCFVCQKN